MTGDFNGDGRLDLIVASSYHSGTGSQIVFFPGKGDGTFGARVTISNMIATALATIRPKPKSPLDLVAVASPVSVPLPYLVQVFPGNGDGTFQAPVSTGIMASTNVVAADFNGDGIPDIASSGQVFYNQPPDFQVVLGKTMAPMARRLTPRSPPHILSLRRTSMAMGFSMWHGAMGRTTFTCTKGNGDGTFSAGPVTGTPAGEVLLAADLNGDGRPDLVMAGMAIAINSGGGKFAPSKWYQNPSGTDGVAGDFRNAGVQDLIVAGDYYQNSGSGTFHAPRSYPAGCLGCGLLATGDFNNDGNLDAAVAAEAHVRVFAGTGGGDFAGSHETTFTFPGKQTISALAAGDFNSDGKLDLAIGSALHGGEVVIAPGNGNGTFGTPSVAYQGNNVYSIVTADFNGDGHTDLAIGTNSGVVVMLGNGAGGFTITATIDGIANSQSVVVADFNHDGIPDLATASDVYLGNGDGTFHHSFTLAESWLYVYTGDFNRDGIPDLLTLSNVVDYWPGIGDGTFGLPLTVSTTGYEVGVVADLNGDGFSDIVTKYSNPSNFDLYRGSEDGTFTLQALSGLPVPSYYPMAAGRFTNSGKTDLLFVSQTNQLLVLINSTK